MIRNPSYHLGAYHHDSPVSKSTSSPSTCAFCLLSAECIDSLKPLQYLLPESIQYFIDQQIYPPVTYTMTIPRSRGCVFCVSSSSHSDNEMRTMYKFICSSLLQIIVEHPLLCQWLFWASDLQSIPKFEVSKYNERVNPVEVSWSQCAMLRNRSKGKVSATGTRSKE